MLLRCFLIATAIKMISCCTAYSTLCGAIDQETIRNNNGSKYIQSCVIKIKRCYPEKHIEGETYLKVTNFLHGYVLNIKNMNPNGECQKECSAFTDTKTEKCFQNKWCKKQPPCPKIVACKYISSVMEVCLSNNVHQSDRRYEYIKYDLENDQKNTLRCKSGRRFYLESQMRGLFDICDYCFCVCEEETIHSDKFVSLRTAMANIKDNRVVTGVRFVKNNRIIHLQIQEGRLAPGGKIDVDTLRWVPVHDYQVTDRNVHEGEDYHRLSWRYRSVHLSDVMAKKGFAITGVKFIRFGGNQRLHLAVVTTPFDSVTGKLVNPEPSSTYKIDSDILFINKFGKELELVKPRVPTKVRNASPVVDTTNKYVQFTISDYEKDAGQTTVPFFDAQPLTQSVLHSTVPLKGVGIFHKAQEGSSGFIAPVIYT